MEELEKKIELLERRFQRERTARKEAEHLLEQKSLQLYQANQQLQRENDRFSTLIQALPIAIMRYNHEQVVAVNPAFHLLFGENPEGLATGEYAHSHRLPLQSHPDKRIQHEIHCGEEVSTVLVQFVPLAESHDENQQHETLMVVIDISDRIKSDEAQQYAAFQAGIAEMSASVLHNIGNIVTGMHGSLMHLGRLPAQVERLEKGLEKALEGVSSVLEQGAEEEGTCRTQLQRNQQVLHASVKILSGLRGQEKMLQYIDKLELGIHHVGEIIQLQQKAARPDTHITRFTLSSMLEDTLSLIQDRIEKFGIEIRLSLDPEIKQVELPRNPMIQMVMNFIKNSMEAIGQRIRQQITHKGWIELKTQRVSGEQFILTISDNGCGIHEDRLEQVFRFGETDKSSGSGYGLHSAAIFVKSLKGEIRAESEGENCGASMVVLLPIELQADET